jgi:hypothetical protein
VGSGKYEVKFVSRIVPVCRLRLSVSWPACAMSAVLDQGRGGEWGESGGRKERSWLIPSLASRG